MRRSVRDDSGNVTLLSLGFAMVAITLILVVSAATALHLDRTRLARLADDLAIDAADAMDVEAFYAGTAPEPTDLAAVRLSPDAMRATVDRMLVESAERYNLDGVQVIDVRTTDGHTVVVTIGVVVEPLFGVEALLPWTDGIELAATSAARAY